MYTDLDVVIIVLFTIFATVMVTFVLFSCLIANSMDERETIAYCRGLADGEKVGKNV